MLATIIQCLSVGIRAVWSTRQGKLPLCAFFGACGESKIAVLLRKTQTANHWLKLMFVRALHFVVLIFAC